MAKKTEAGMSMIDMTKLVMQGALKNVYLFYGSETFLKTFFSNKIVERIGGNKESLIKLDGKVRAGDLADSLDSSPMFSEQTIVIVKNTGAFKTNLKGDYDYSFLKEISEDSFCIFQEDEVDKRNQNYKLVESIGMVFECNEQSLTDVQLVLQKRVQSMGLKIDTGAVATLYNGVGKDLNTLVNEVDRLSLLVPEGGTITEAIVKKTSELSIEARTYDFTDAVADKNAEKAMKLLNSMLADRMPEQIIMAALSKHFSNMYTAMGLSDEHFSNKEIAEKLKTFDFLISKYIRQSQKFSKDTVADIVNYIGDIDYRTKNGMLDIGVGLEMIIQYIC